MYFLNNKDFIDKLSKLDKPLTITTPIISENNLQKLKSFLKSFDFKNDFEIVINDY